MSEDYEQFEDDVGLGTEDKKHASNNRQEWFKGEQGKKYRVGLLYFNPLEFAVAKALKAKDPGVDKATVAEAIKKVLAKRAADYNKEVDQLAPHERLDTTNVRFKKIVAHYQEGLGFVVSRLGKDGPEADQVWKQLKDPKTYFTTVLLFYPVNKEGGLLKDQLQASYVMPWRFSGKVYETLLSRAEALRENDLSIATQDLILKCTNGDFQNFDIDAAGPSVWQRSKQFGDAMLAKAMELYDKLEPFREMSTADLRDKLGLSSPAGSESAGADDEFSSLLDGVV